MKDDILGQESRNQPDLEQLTAADDVIPGQPKAKTPLGLILGLAAVALVIVLALVLGGGKSKAADYLERREGIKNSPAYQDVVKDLTDLEAKFDGVG